MSKLWPAKGKSHKSATQKKAFVSCWVAKLMARFEISKPIYVSKAFCRLFSSRCKGVPSPQPISKSLTGVAGISELIAFKIGSNNPCWIKIRRACHIRSLSYSLTTLCVKKYIVPCLETSRACPLAHKRVWFLTWLNVPWQIGQVNIFKCSIKKRVPRSIFFMLIWPQL